jgi:peptide/nickel transport system permease protein
MTTVGAHRHWPPALIVGTIILLIMAVGAALVAMLPSLEPRDGDLTMRLSPPLSGAGLLGTDALGRDVLARTLAGVLWSTTAAFTATAIALTIGASLGLFAAEVGGRTRSVVELAVNSVITLPGLIVAIVISAVIGQGWLPIVLTLGLVTWPVFARVVMAEASSLRARDFVAAARLIGQPRHRVVFGHILPSLRPTLAVMAAFHFADMLIAEGALSFLGLAAPLGIPTWGNMLADSRPYVFSAPWLLLAPAGAIVLTVIAANLVGDGIERPLAQADE